MALLMVTSLQSMMRSCVTKVRGSVAGEGSLDGSAKQKSTGRAVTTILLTEIAELCEECLAGYRAIVPCREMADHGVKPPSFESADEIVKPFAGSGVRKRNLDLRESVGDVRS